MSAGVLGIEVRREADWEEHAAPRVQTIRPNRTWTPESFAREQIRGLVSQVFSLSTNPQIRQVVISAIEPEAEIRSICKRVAAILAQETGSEVGIVAAWANESVDSQERAMGAERRGSSCLRESAVRIQENVWLTRAQVALQQASVAAVHTYLGEIRSEFQYSILEGPCAGISNDAALLGRFADGIILVISAERTRRVTARKIKESIEAAKVRLLGVMLSDREFPIPEQIYRRL